MLAVRAPDLGQTDSLQLKKHSVYCQSSGNVILFMAESVASSSLSREVGLRQRNNASAVPLPSVWVSVALQYGNALSTLA